MKIISSIVVIGIILACVTTLLIDFTGANSGQSRTNVTCGAKCFSNVTSNLTGSFYQSSYNPAISIASKSINLSNNLTASSQAVGFAFAFLPNDVGNILTSIVQAPKLFASVLQVSLGNLGIIIGDNQSLTLLVVSGVIALLIFYITIAFLSAWLKYPL
jgi:hypothetical protein